MTQPCHKDSWNDPYIIKNQTQVNIIIYAYINHSKAHYLLGADHNWCLYKGEAEV